MTKRFSDSSPKSLIKFVAKILFVTFYYCFFSDVVLAGNPSFNCGRATKPDELAICGDDTLSANDQIMSDEYINMKQRVGKAEGNRIAKQYLSRRRDCGSNVSCIANIQIEAVNTYRSYGTGNDTPSSGNENTYSNDNVSQTYSSSNVTTSNSNNDIWIYAGGGASIAMYLYYLYYRYSNSEKCPSCGTRNWHSEATSADLLDRKMRMGTRDNPRTYGDHTVHHFTNYIYYDELFRFHMICKNCGYSWQVTRKKTG